MAHEVEHRWSFERARSEENCRVPEDLLRAHRLDVTPCKTPNLGEQEAGESSHPDKHFTLKQWSELDKRRVEEVLLGNLVRFCRGVEVFRHSCA